MRVIAEEVIQRRRRPPERIGGAVHVPARGDQGALDAITERGLHLAGLDAKLERDELGDAATDGGGDTPFLPVREAGICRTSGLASPPRRRQGVYRTSPWDYALYTRATWVLGRVRR